MYCKNCGFENKDSAKYCENCGVNLNFHSNFNKNYTTQPHNSNSSNNNILIICITLIIILLIVTGAFLYISNNNSSNNNVVSSNDNGNLNNKVSADNSANSNSEVSSTSTPLKIISGSFTTGSLPAKTYITVYVGEKHAGEQVKIRVFYYHGSNQLNAGNIVPLTVESSGYFTMRTANELSSYPDYAEITLYEGNGNIVDTKNVNMNPVSGTQSF